MRRWFVVGGLLLAAACAEPDGLTLVDSPAAPGSAEPSLVVGADDRLYLSWVETLDESRHALRYAVWTGEAWSGARTVAAGSDWFVNWADFPSIHALADGTLAAHWRVQSGEEEYAYDVVVSVSSDDGHTWSDPMTPHRDGTESEHGFVSLVPSDAGAFDLVWLDGREMEDGGPMTLRHATLDRNGVVAASERLDSRVCDCCPTDALRTADGSLLVLYRDRTEDEIRDIHRARLENGTWSVEGPVHDDGWVMPACPVNGPALARAGDRVAAAWFTLASAPKGAVLVSLSADGGRSFAPPVRVDDGSPVGRVDAVFVDEETVRVSWLEAASIRVRDVAASGPVGDSRVVVASSNERASGFPEMARLDGRTFLAWTVPGDPSRVRTGFLEPGR